MSELRQPQAKHSSISSQTMDGRSDIQTELPALELVDGTADDPALPRSSEISASLTWQLGSDAFLYRHRFFLLTISALAFFLDAVSYTGLASIGPEFLNGNRTEVDVLYGLLFSVGPAVSLLVMPIGSKAAVYSGPLQTLFPAFAILAVSALLMAMSSGVARATRYEMVVVARAISGIGTGLARSSVPAVAAAAHDTESKRNEALSFALLGLGLGETLGPAFTGTCAALGLALGWNLAFFAISGLAVVGSVLALVAQRRLSEEGVHLRVPWDYRPSTLRLLRDKLVVIICLASMLAESCISIIPAVLVPWLRSSFDVPPPWQLGLLMLAPNLSYLAATPLLIVCHVPQARSRVALAMASLLLMSLSLCVLPFLPTARLLLVLSPLAGLGVGAAVFDLCMLPVLSGRLVTDYSVKQNAVYKFQNFTLALAFAIGPLAGTGLASSIGYDWTFFTFSMLLLVCTPVLCLLQSADDTSGKHIDIASPW